MAARTDIHASGMPDTPVEEVTDLLSQALRSSDAAKMKSLVQRAHDIIGGLDPYMESVSSKPSQVTVLAVVTCMHAVEAIAVSDDAKSAGGGQPDSPVHGA